MIAIDIDAKYKVRPVRFYGDISSTLMSMANPKSGAVNTDWIYDNRVYAKNLGLGGGGVGGISRQRQCAWCINCADGCATTVLAHYHKAGASNLIGETFSTQET